MKKLTNSQKLDQLLKIEQDSDYQEAIINAIRNNREIAQVEHGLTHKLLTIVAVSAIVGAVSIVVLTSYVVG